MTTPAVTVIIPTRHRPESLARTIAALGRQDLPAGQIEVVVVDDGDGDRPPAIDPRAPLEVRVLRTSGRGAAAARNTGAAAARARLLLFLDDDIEASPALVGGHLEAHRLGASLSVGDLPACATAASGFFAVTLRNWWEAMFARMRLPGHRFTFRDVLTGNCGVSADLFRRVGGFDTSLACHEDYEFGVRALRAGARMTFCPTASGIHHELTTLERSLERKRAEGCADVSIVGKHPDLLPSLPLGGAVHWHRAKPDEGPALAFDVPARADTVLARHRRWLDILEGARMRGRWRRRLERMLAIAYWQGVASATGRRDVLEGLVRSATAAAARPGWWTRVDMREGLAAVERQLDSTRPDGVVVVCGGEFVGVLAPVPGAEPLRGAHLRAVLTEALAWPVLRALGRSGTAAIEERGGRLVPAACLPREAVDLR